MPQGPRTDRVSEEFREILAESIQGLKDPRIGFVTVTGVRVSPDLHVAWVFYTVLGEEKERVATRAALRMSRMRRARLGWVAERYPAIVRRIVADGHEVASHTHPAASSSGTSPGTPTRSPPAHARSTDDRHAASDKSSGRPTCRRS